MERRKWILTIVSITAVCAAVLVVVHIMLSGGISDGYCHAAVSLYHPVSPGENVWSVGIEDVEIRGDCPYDIENFGVGLELNGSAVAASYELRSGLVAQSDPVLIFFADRGRPGILDEGDLFYLVNLEKESEYDFYVLDAGASKVGHAVVYT